MQLNTVMNVHTINTAAVNRNVNNEIIRTCTNSVLIASLSFIGTDLFPQTNHSYSDILPQNLFCQLNRISSLNFSPSSSI